MSEFRSQESGKVQRLWFFSLQIFQRDGRKIEIGRRAPPPLTGASTRRCVGEVILVTDDAKIARRSLWKWIAREQRENFGRAAQQVFAEREHPGIFRRRTERGEP